MKPIPEAIKPFWALFEKSVGTDLSSRFFEGFYFDDNEPSANTLAELVLAGTKRATTSLLWYYEHSGESIPAAGNLSVVTMYDGTPRCVIETTAVEVVEFGDVTEQFAFTEGEGDRSLRYWREVHWAFFTKECAQIGREPNPRMPVVCERFEVVYQ